MPAVQIQRNVFEPIITVFVANGERYNLLNSVILEMFDFIRRENLKMLISHFMERHYSRVDDVDYDPTFAKLKDRYEQSQGGRVTAGPGGPQLQENRRRKDERALDRGKLPDACGSQATWHCPERRMLTHQ